MLGALRRGPTHPECQLEESQDVNFRMVIQIVAEIGTRRKGLWGCIGSQLPGVSDWFRGLAPGIGTKSP